MSIRNQKEIITERPEDGNRKAEAKTGNHKIS